MESAWTVGILTGLISGLIVSALFYFLSGRDLIRETKELRRINGVVLRAIRDSNAEVEYEDGAPVRLHFKIQPEPAELKLTGGIVKMTHLDKDGDVIEER